MIFLHNLTSFNLYIFFFYFLTFPCICFTYREKRLDLATVQESNMPIMMPMMMPMIIITMQRQQHECIIILSKDDKSIQWCVSNVEKKHYITMCKESRGGSEMGGSPTPVTVWKQYVGFYRSTMIVIVKLQRENNVIPSWIGWSSVAIINGNSWI